MHSYLGKMLFLGINDYISTNKVNDATHGNLRLHICNQLASACSPASALLSSVCPDPRSRVQYPENDPLGSFLQPFEALRVGFDNRAM